MVIGEVMKWIKKNFSKNFCKLICSNKESCRYGNGHVGTWVHQLLYDSLERMKYDKKLCMTIEWI